VRLEDVTAKIAAGLVELDATPYQHGGVTEVWNEAPIPLDPVYQPESVEHLSFSVLARTSDVTAEERGPHGSVIRCRSQIDVSFAYRLRPTEMLTDSRSAMAAARAVISLVNGEELWGSESDVIVTVTQRYKPVVTLQDCFQLTTTSFAIEHDEEI
jgi:hypothetical protein